METQIESALLSGLSTLSGDEKITFTVYSRKVLPVDGYVFWVAQSTVTVPGSLHLSADIEQTDTQLAAVATAHFTTSKESLDMDGANNQALIVASRGPFRFAFSAQLGFYEEARLWHYLGRSVLPSLASQLLDSSRTIDFTRAVTSNSLSLWLALPNFVSLTGAPSVSIPIYPSLLTELDVEPPYAVVHIGNNDTSPLQPIRYLSSNRTRVQLMRDRVELRLFGLQSDESLDFLDAVLAYSQESGDFGIMNSPAVIDLKDPQVEIQAIAMEKSIPLEVSYYQSRVASVARQLITSAVPTISFS